MGISASFLFYIGFLFLTLITAIVSNFKNRLIPFAYITIIISLLVPTMNLILISGKPADMSGTIYLLQEFQARNLWAVLITFMYVYLIAWIVLFNYVLYGKSFTKGYHYLVEKGKGLWMFISKKIKKKSRNLWLKNKKQEKSDHQ